METSKSLKNLSTKELLLKVLDQIIDVNSNFPNGEITELREDLSNFAKENKNDHDAIRKSMRDMKLKLYDPDDGVIVKVNKNTEFRQDCGGSDFKTKFVNLLNWKNNANKMLWLVCLVLLSLLVKLVAFPTF